MAYILMAYIVMAYILMAYVVMAYIGMAYIVMVRASRAHPRPAAAATADRVELAVRADHC